MSDFAWRSSLFLPVKREEGWGTYERGVYKSRSEDITRKAVLRWFPALPILFGCPGSRALVPPTEISELRDSAMRSVRRNFWNLSTATGGSALAFLGVSFLQPQSTLFLLGLLLFALCCIICFDYCSSLRDRAAVTERALFFFWLRTSAGFWLGGIGAAIFMIALGILQLVMQGGADNTPAFQDFGSMYAQLEEGEYWRLLTGAYLHYSIVHFLSNLLLLIIVGAAASVIVGWRMVLIFVVGNLFSGWAQWALGPLSLGSYGGVSGGIYALYGVLLGVGFKHKLLYPKGLLIYFTGVGLLGIISTGVVSSNAANIAHFSGLGLGFMLGLIIKLPPRIFFSAGGG